VAGYDRLSAQDRSFLELEGPTTHMHVAGCFVFDRGPLATPEGGVDVDKIRDYVGSRLHRIPRYRQRIEWIPLEDHPVWVDDDRFNIHYHVRHTCLPEPGDDRQLKRLCGRIMSQQLDRGKPLWEMWIVEGLEHDRFALISKVHHCMIDGISGVDLLAVLLSPTPEKEFEGAPRWLPNAAPSRATLLRDAALRRAALPFRLAGELRLALGDPGAWWGRTERSLRGLGQSLAVAWTPADETPLNRPIGPHRRFDWIAFDMEEVRRVKRALGGTVNDVVLATVCGAVTRFLEQRSVSAARQRRMAFRCVCPVSVRSEEERGTLGNRVSALMVPLPIGQHDPRKRLAAVRAVTRDLKESHQALGAEVLTSVSEWIAPTLATLAARIGFANRVSNMVVTNVPGPRIPLYLLGARMSESYPMVPLFRSQGLGVALFSYGSGLFWGVSADWDHFPDLHDFVIALDTSFRELGEVAEAAERSSSGA
jgi:diacylglycerol O-acyltransferase